MKFPIERVFQVLVLLILVWMLFFLKGVMQKELPDTTYTKVESSWKADAKQKANFKIFQESLEEIRQPRSILTEDKEGFRNIFVPPIEISTDNKIIICDNCGGKNKEGAVICSYCGSPIVGPGDSDNDGMPDYWEIKYKLDPKDPEDAHQDPDHDGRDNLQEFKDGTDPLVADTPGKKQEIPEVPFKVLNTYQKPVQILFMGYMLNVEGQYTVQINWAGKTDFYKIGDEIRGYVLKDFQKVEEKEFDPKTGVTKFKDNSFITCQKKKFPPKKFLKEKLVTDNDVFAKIEVNETLKTQEVFIDYVFEDTASGKIYKVIDIGLNPSKLIVEDQNKKSYTLFTQEKQS